jgi:hypothetical protein
MGFQRSKMSGGRVARKCPGGYHLAQKNHSRGTRMKKFLIGFIVGALIAFHLGINFGRHKPLLSNPYAADDVVEQVKESAGQAIESTKEVIHEATEPARRDVEKKLSR